MEAKPFPEVVRIPLEQLALDHKNPRFHPPASESASQIDLALRLIEEDDALVVARSIAHHGYYPWEVLVVISNLDDFIVVEGNRRLSALRGLTDPELRKLLPEAKEWEALAEKASTRLDGTAPCVVAESRQAAQPALGYRHISGIAPWGPYAQARFIAHLIEHDRLEETEVAEVTGKTVGWVRDVYRNYRVTQQAEGWGLESEAVFDSFSLMDVALAQRGIKDFLGVAAASPVSPSSNPIPETHKEKLGVLIGLIWGDEERDPVITDSRQIRRLGRVINDPDAMRLLEEGKSLDEAAAEATDDEVAPADAVLHKLDQAIRATEIANKEVRSADGEALSDPRVTASVERFQDLASQLVQAAETG